MPKLDRFALYTLCVQNPPMLARFLRAVHGGDPRLLREDFSGAAGICGAWIELSSVNTAIAVDQDPGALRHAPRDRRLKRVASDVVKATQKADIIAAINFPIGYWHTRAELIRYLRMSRRRLARGGVFVCDMYGGATAFTTGTTLKRLRGSRGERITYQWEQRDADAVSGMVHNAIHFEVHGNGARKARRIRDAFTYHWRLWAIPEMIDAMHEAGFGSVDVYDRLGDAMDSDGNLYVRPVSGDDRLDENWVVYLAARG